MTAQDQQSRVAYEDGKWYWVEREGWHGEPPTIAPACYKADCDAWYSLVFSGITTRFLTVLEPCERQAAQVRADMGKSQDSPSQDGPWKCGNEFLPYHPSASHVEPAYRDGWNACYAAASAIPAVMEPVAWVDMEEWPPIRWREGMMLPDFYSIDGAALYTAAQVQAMGRVPPGWHAVPNKPAHQQLDVIQDAVRELNSSYATESDLKRVYQELLAAAPRPPEAATTEPAHATTGAAGLTAGATPALTPDLIEENRQLIWSAIGAPLAVAPATVALAKMIEEGAVPAFSSVAMVKLESLKARGYVVTGYAIEKPVPGAEPDRGFIDHGGFVGWWQGSRWGEGEGGGMPNLRTSQASSGGGSAYSAGAGRLPLGGNEWGAGSGSRVNSWSLPQESPKKPG